MHWALRSWGHEPSAPQGGDAYPAAGRANLPAGEVRRSHAELLAQGKLYAGLCSLQAAA